MTSSSSSSNEGEQQQQQQLQYTRFGGNVLLDSRRITVAKETHRRCFLQECSLLPLSVHTARIARPSWRQQWEHVWVCVVQQQQQTYTFTLYWIFLLKVSLLYTLETAGSTAVECLKLYMFEVQMCWV